MQVIIWPLLNNQWSEALISAAPHLVFKYGGHERGGGRHLGYGEEWRGEEVKERRLPEPAQTGPTGYRLPVPRDPDDTLALWAAGGGWVGRLLIRSSPSRRYQSTEVMSDNQPALFTSMLRTE